MIEPVEEHESDSASQVAEPRASRPLPALVAVLLVVLVSGIVSALVAYAVVRSQSRTNPQTVDLGSNVTISEDSAVEQVATRALPAVVSIITAQPGNSSARGSGFFVTKDGYIVTDTRVLAGATSLSVRLPDDTKLRDARIVDSDCQTGLAVLKVDGVNDLPTLAFGDSDGLKLGQTVVALGGPLETRGRVLHAVVSDNHQPVQVPDPLVPSRQLQRSDAIQLDSTVPSGDSGGPLLNVGGEVVGVNVSVPSSSGATSFSLPARILQAEVQQVLQTGQLTQPSIGAQWTDLTPDVAAAAGLSAGALVTSVTRGGAADQAGIRAGDVLTQLDENKVDAAHPLSELLITQYRPGQRVTLTINRGGAASQVGLTLVPAHPAC